MAIDALVVYDSQYGNTEQIARAIAGALGGTVLHAGRVDGASAGNYGLLIVGSPTQGGRPTAAVKAFLDGLEKDGLDGRPVAAFDTRIPGEGSNVFLRVLMKLIGFAAGKIAGRCRQRGAGLSRHRKDFWSKARRVRWWRRSWSAPRRGREQWSGQRMTRAADRG